MALPGMRGTISALTSCGLAAASLVALAATPALATASKPPTDYTFYMLDGSSSNAYNLGCNQGTYDSQHGTNSLVFLDFGGQKEGGTEEINNNDVDFATIESMSENFAAGYYDCTGSDTSSFMDLAIGTNNSLSYVNNSGGADWANVVSTVENSTLGKDVASQVNFEGGSDLENWGLANPEGAKDWAQGFASGDAGSYLDYGSADGCPQSTHGNGGCNGSYTQYDYWYLAWGNSSALADPEIYFDGNQQEWTQISYYGAVNWSAPIGFSAELDEYDLDNSSYTNSDAWSEFWNAINQYSATAMTPTYSTEVHDE